MAVEFDRRALSDELLIDDEQFVALSGFTDASECSAVPYTNPYTNTDVFILVVPAPLDISCGSEIKVSEINTYSIMNFLCTM